MRTKNQLNTIHSDLIYSYFFIRDGQNQTNCQEIYCTESAPQATCCSENSPQVRPHCFRCEEASPLQARNGCFEID